MPITIRREPAVSKPSDRVKPLFLTYIRQLPYRNSHFMTIPTSLQASVDLEKAMKSREMKKGVLINFEINITINICSTRKSYSQMFLLRDTSRIAVFFRESGISSPEKKLLGMTRSSR